MIKSITVINYVGEEIKIDMFNDEPEHGLLIKKIEGLGPPKANINTIESSLVDGAYYTSSNLDVRNIVVSLYFSEAPRIEDARKNTYKYFPIKRPLEMIVETDTRTARIKGYVESNEPDIWSKRESAQISILCPDPYFYALEPTVTRFFGSDPLFEFPFAINIGQPIAFSELISNRKERIINYSGDSDIGIVIKIHINGEIGDSINIYKYNTQEQMTIHNDAIAFLTGQPLKNGDEITISTLRGKKFATLLREAETINIFNAVDKRSSWFQLFQGSNVFVYISDENSGNINLEMHNDVIYEGM